MTPKSKCPVTVLTGCLGSGKTSFLTRILKKNKMLGTAVLVNEFGKVPLDHHLLRQVSEKTVLLHGGCVCCTTREDLVQELKDLLNLHERGEIPALERVIIETTGLADPAPMMFTILTDPVLTHHFEPDCVLTTFDTVNGSFQLEHQPEALKQIVVADTILLTKTDIVTSDQVHQLKERLHRLNPSAQILSSFAAARDPGVLTGKTERNMPINQKLQQKSSSNPKLLNQKEAGIVHTGKQDKHDGIQGHHISNIRTVSFMFDQPLDWTAFGLWLSMLLHARGEDVLRVKGLINVGEKGPVVLNGVQHIIHPPTHLQDWPDEDRRSRMIFITNGIEADDILRSLRAFQEFLGSQPKLMALDVRL